jgi:hypothetical protein
LRATVSNVVDCTAARSDAVCHATWPLRCSLLLLPHTGQLPRRYPAAAPAPYARVVSQLQRLWEYGDSVEAQLKVWLARHLLARANPGAGLAGALSGVVCCVWRA